MHQYGFVGLRPRRLDAGGRQRKCGHENDEARAYDAKEGVIHGSHRRCNLGFDSTTRIGIGFRLFCRRATVVPRSQVAKCATKAAMPNENTHAATIDQKAIAIGLGMRSSLVQSSYGGQVGLLGWPQSRRIGPIVEVRGRIRLPGPFQQIVSFGARTKLRGLAAGLFREHHEAILQGRCLFRATSFGHCATPCLS